MAHIKENRRFVRIARGSLNETKHFLRRAYRRELVTDEQVHELKPMLDEFAPHVERLSEIDWAERTNRR